MAVPFSNTKLRVPQGFQNLLEGFAREVLRSQPEELYAFGAQYFESLLKQREETGIDPAEHGAKMEDRYYNNKAFTQPEIDASDPQQQDAALAIQKKFRQHAAKQEVEVIRQDKAATKIQAGFRGYQDRQKVKDIDNEDDGVDTETAAEGREQEQQEEVDIDLNDPEVAAAAVKIQAGFKGFKTRKDMAERKSAKSEAGGEAKSSPNLPTTDTKSSQLQSSLATAAHLRVQNGKEVDIDLEDPEVEKAALKIQAGFRGMKTRSDIRAANTTADLTAGAIEEEGGDGSGVDIDLTDPQVERAAIKIQAGFKGMKTRSNLKQQHQQIAMASVDDDKAVGQEEAVDIDLTDPQVEQAAIKIQAGFKGMRTRNNLKQQHQQQIGVEEEVVDIDLTDPEVQKAATKIQAGFRGMQTRKTLTNPKNVDILRLDDEVADADNIEGNTGTDKNGTAEESIDIDLDDPAVEKAAVKIQASFKGFKTRKQLNTKNQQDTEQNQVPVAVPDEMVEAPVVTRMQELEVKEEPTKCAAPEFEAAEELLVDEVEVQEVEKKQMEEEEVDIDLNDPDVEAAAVKIQAGFKGFKTRKEMSAKRSASAKSGSAEAVKAEEETAEGTDSMPAADENPADDKPAEEEMPAEPEESSPTAEESKPAEEGNVDEPAPTAE